MIRVAIFSDKLSRARALADLLADDHRLEVIEVRSYFGGDVNVVADVVVGIGLGPSTLTGLRTPAVIISDSSPHFGGIIRALLPHAASPAEIGAAIEAVAHDLVVLTAEQAIRWLPTSATSSDQLVQDELIEELTPREQQVLRLMADGSGNKDIALTLGISEHTVKFHVAQILAKLNAGSRTEAVSVGIRRGLIAV